jgi:hypothetical protein
MLRQAIADLGRPELVEAALAWYDDPLAYTETALSGNHEPAWAESDRNPSPDELASDVFLHLMMEEGYIGVIDWADGPEQMAETFDMLFARSKVAPLDACEREALDRVCAGSKRGECFHNANDALASMIRARQLGVRYLDMGWDAHVPILGKEALLIQWQQRRFGKRFPVLP